MRIVVTCLVSVLFAVLPTQAPAATLISITAGEHGTFSRVAIPFESVAEWASAQDGRSVQITLPGVTGPVDTSAIFPRRAAHRVLSVTVSRTADATKLTFELSCRCTAKIYRWKRGKILMDVRDGGPGESPSAGPVKNPDHPAAGIGQEIAPLDIEKARIALMERVQAAADAGVVQMSVDEQPGQTSTSAPETPAGATDAEQEVVAAVAMVYRTEQPTPTLAADPVPASGLPPAPANVTAPQNGEDEKPPAINIMFGNDVTQNSQKNCLADSALNLGAWRSQESFSKELAQKRVLLLGEFDAPDEDAGLALARFYLSHGLGEEAALIMAEFVSVENPQGGVVSDLANIFRNHSVSPDGPILGAGQCGGAHGLWQAAALALNERWQDAAKAEKRSGDALAQLPRNIRIPLGVKIAEAALNAGQMEQVRRILALLRRSERSNFPALDLVEGKFALAERRSSRARSLLDPLTRSTHPEAVEATLALSKTELVSPGFLSEERLLDLALIAMERRYTPLGREALILTAWAETAAGRPGLALDILSREADSSSLASEKAELRREIAQTLFGLYKPGSGKTSLQDTDLFWRYESYLGDNETARVIRRGAARHLLAKGLPNAAITLLRRPGTEQGPPLLLARALLAAGRPVQALNILEPYSDLPQTLETRSTALADLGRYRDAAGLIPESTRDPSLLQLKASLLWSDGQWEPAARLYARLAGTVSQDQSEQFNRRLAAATYMAGDADLTLETLALLKANDDTGLSELLAPVESTSLSLPERVDQSLETARTVTRILKELLADG